MNRHAALKAGSKPHTMRSAQMDMWFNVRAPLPAPIAALWSPAQGLLAPCSHAPSCHDVRDRSAASKPDGCPWYHEARPNCRRAVLALGGSTCCMGWSDLLYVPAAQLDRFVEVSRVLRAHQVRATPASARARALDVHWMCTACALVVHCMCTRMCAAPRMCATCAPACALHVHCMCTA